MAAPDQFAEPARMELVVELARLAVSAHIDNGRQTPCDLLGAVQIGGDAAAGDGLEVQFLDAEIFPDEFAGDYRLQVGSLGQRPEPEHFQELAPVLFAPAFPGLQGGTVGEALFGERSGFGAEFGAGGRNRHQAGDAGVDVHHRAAGEVEHAQVAERGRCIPRIAKLSTDT